MTRMVGLQGREVQVEVTESGHGRPLVYLHGAFGPEWSSGLLESLGEHFSVYAPSLPGYGESGGLEAVSTFADLAVYLEETMDALGLERAAVVGHDFGGAAAAEFAAYFRGRVEALVLLAPLGLWDDEMPVADIFGLTPGALTRALFASPESAAALAFNSRSRDRAEAQREILRRRQALIAAAKLLWPIPEKGLRKRLYRVTAPTLIVWGRDDHLAPPAYAERFASLIAGSRIERVEGGHMLPQEATDDVVSIVKEFLGVAQPASVR